MNAQIKQVVEATTSSYQGKNAPMFVHKITLNTPVPVEGEMVDTFEFHTESVKCIKFVAGQFADFDVSKKVNGKYINYKITPILGQKPAFQSGGFKKQETKDQGTITALSAASTAATFYSNRGAVVSEAALMALAETIFNWAQSKSSLK
jgi:hypothetical protein